jgi:hypothetical protein
MTITIDLQPSVEKQIVARANAANLSVEDFVQKLLRESVNTTDEPEEFSLEEFERDMDALTEGLENFKSDYRGSYSREDIYFDHD